MVIDLLFLYHELHEFHEFGLCAEIIRLISVIRGLFLIWCGTVSEFGGHKARLIAVGMLFEEVREEEQFQHRKDDEQLDEDNRP